MPTHIRFQENKAVWSFNIDDRIFLGEGLFETMRVVEGRVRYPRQHWQRLNQAAFFLGIVFEVSLDLWLEKLNDFIQLTKMQNGGIKAILSGGSAPRGLLQHAKESQLVFDAFQYEMSTQALSLISAPWRRDARNPIYQMKSVNYLEAIIARRHAQSVEADEVLFFNFQNQATDTTVANFFLIQNNQVLTPSLENGVVPGIIRQRLLFLCKEQGIAYLECAITKEQIIQAEAAFTTNALQGIRPICLFDGHHLNTANPIMDLLQSLLPGDQE
ncbi:Aminodeoxychorismate lyase [Legionella massiliensis]|uniref:Aminodeoxychorismate lyase n=1 Tax=Legionella massiliensis TaxID=1034943 RepID=A0A078KR55_9GAMM|nr:aminotransferase class IV [Legionella massiliensis]CDZ76905.1 Aminodeoxychorismate lyase [Legionella massiliensis]CEE12643.1 Aminodeoxychorismate lyase [Legionella massiliensis]